MLNGRIHRRFFRLESPIVFQRSRYLLQAPQEALACLAATWKFLICIRRPVRPLRTRRGLQCASSVCGGLCARMPRDEAGARGNGARQWQADDSVLPMHTGSKSSAIAVPQGWQGNTFVGRNTIHGFWIAPVTGAYPESRSTFRPSCLLIRYQPERKYETCIRIERRGLRSQR